MLLLVLIFHSLILINFRFIDVCFKARSLFDKLVYSFTVSIICAFISMLILVYFGVLTPINLIILIIGSLIILGIFSLSIKKSEVPKNELQFITGYNLFGIFMLSFLAVGSVNLSSWMAPVQSDSNSYNLVGILIGKSHSLDLSKAYSYDIFKDLNINNIETFDQAFFSSEEKAYKNFGMPLFPTIVGVVYQNFGIESIQYIPAFFVGLSILLFATFISNFSKNKAVIIFSIIIFSLNPAQVILMKKLYNESITQILIILLLMNNLNTFKFQRKVLVNLLILIPLISIRIETILIAILWILFLFWERKIRNAFITLGVVLFFSFFNFYYNSDYVSSDFLKRFSLSFNVPIPYIIAAAIALIIGGLVLVLLISRFSGKLSPFIDSKSKYILGFVVIAGFIGNFARSISFYSSSNFSFNETLINLFPVDYINIENIIIPRLSLFITYTVILGGIIGLLIYLFKHSKFNFIHVFIVFYLLLFLTTSQHDPNIIPWSRRYVYMIIPVFILFFSIFMEWFINKKLISFESVKILLLLLIIPIFLESSFFLFNSEFSGGKDYISQVYSSDSDINSKVVLIDYMNNSSSINNLKICPSLNIIYGINCINIADVYNLPIEVFKSDKQIIVLSLKKDLDPSKFTAYKQIIVTLNSFSNGFFSIPNTTRESTFGVYFYEVKKLDQIMPSNSFI